MSFQEPNPKPNEALSYAPSSEGYIASGRGGDKAGENTSSRESRGGRSLAKSVEAVELELVQNAKRKRKATPAVTTSHKRVKTTEAYEVQNAEMKRDASEDVAAGKKGAQKRKHIQKGSKMSAPVPAAPVAPVAPSAMTTVRLKLTYTPPNAELELLLKLRIKNSSSSLKQNKTAGRSGQEGERTQWEREEALRIQEIDKEKRILEEMKVKYKAVHTKRHKIRIQGAQESEERTREAQQDETRAQEDQESPERAREVKQARKRALLAQRAEKKRAQVAVKAEKRAREVQQAKKRASFARRPKEKRRAQVVVQAEKRARKARELEKRAHRKTDEEEMRDPKAFQERMGRVVAAWTAQEASKEVSEAASAE